MKEVNQVSPVPLGVQEMRINGFRAESFLGLLETREWNDVEDKIQKAVEGMCIAGRFETGENGGTLTIYSAHRLDPLLKLGIIFDFVKKKSGWNKNA